MMGTLVIKRLNTFSFFFFETSLLLNSICLSFDLLGPFTPLNLLLATLYLVFGVSVFCTFSNAVHAGYRE